MQSGTGKPLSGSEHLRQSIADILTTPIGTRVMRRSYGSHLADLIDQPFNRVTRMRLFGAVATALQRWEPRLRLTRVDLQRGGQPGAFVIRLEGQRTDQPTRAAGIVFDLQLSVGAAAGGARLSIA